MRLLAGILSPRHCRSRVLVFDIGGIDPGITDSILVKVNQIGTLTETLLTVNGLQGRLLGGHVAPFGRDRSR